MLDSILEQARRMDFDFRQVASPDDPLRHLFGEWVEYYRLKAAIARVLQPKSILEIGVRFGYSAAAFLHGCPTASYVGIDNDSESSGGCRGAIQWARAILKGRPAEFLLQDSQAMTRLPGGLYDLIHVDGQQDGDGTWHDLELAVRQGRHVLLDGYFWTSANFQAASEFLFQHKDVLEFYWVVPGYSGELLLKTRAPSLHQAASAVADATPDSRSLRDTYTARYYLRDCGGWDSFQRHRGRQIADPRLGSIVDLALMNTPRRLLDLGCGRGEITYAAASRGIRITALDYSPQAIEIARDVCGRDDPAAGRVGWVCADAATAQLDGDYDAVVASDIIEHLAPAEVDKVCTVVARHLAPRGRFIVHTFPNRWYYRYDYPRRRRAAAALGAYLPREPRTRYEKLMHINEQSPGGLRRQLKRHFKHVLLWFAHPDQPAGSLARRFSRREMAAARDLYAIASQEPVAANDVARALQVPEISARQARQIRVEVLDCPDGVAAGSEFEVRIRIANESGVALGSYLPWPVCVAYHWVDAQTGAKAIHDGRRTNILPSLPARSARELSAIVIAPPRKGRYTLQVRLVQEKVRWFEESQAVGSDRDLTIH